MSTNSQKKILVFGAGGVQGGAVARKLLSEGYSVKSIARSEEKAVPLRAAGISTVIADLSDNDGLREAYQDVNKVFLLLPIEFNRNKATSYIHNVVDAAKAANVDLLVVNTGVVVSDRLTDVAAVEIKREFIDYIKASGIPYLILQPTLYFENFHIPGVLNGNVLAYPVPDNLPIAWISIDEAAEYAVEALKHPELAGQIIPIGGPEALTGNQLAQRFSHTLGRDVQFYSLPVPVFEEAVGSLLGAENGAGLAGLYAWIGDNSSLLSQPGPTIQLQVLPHTLTSWIEENAGKGFFASNGN
ncbi:NAD(P)H azoreductase [compost metagenome]